MKLIWTLTLCCICFTAFAGKKKIHAAKDIDIIPITEHVLIHVSYLQTETFGKVACNGIIYINGNEAVFADTPPDDSASARLLDWFAEAYPGVTIVAVIPEHFHNDCLGGLNEFHRRGIPSYAHQETRDKAAENKFPVPQNTFGKSLELKVGDKTIQCYYPGPAHTHDNIVLWIPAEELLFGGCMVKAKGADKGYLGDADVAEWSNTVRRVKQAFGKAKKVVPGHGDTGGKELLNYTIKLFDKR